MLKIKNLKGGIEDKEILKGIDLEVPQGKVHVLMGPNGSGKSSLSQMVMGNPAYEVTGGEIFWKGEEILGKEADEIAQKGLFLSFQNPLEIEGVSFSEFLRLSYNSVMKARNEDFEEVKAADFMKVLREKMSLLNMKSDFVDRYLNQGFSGGEKKKSEILQMLLLEPELAIIDEIDSGLDIDALKTVAEGINVLISQGTGVLIITHYKRILDYIKADKVHIIVDGKIVEEGDASLVNRLEEEGFGWAQKEATAKKSALKMA